MPRLIHGTAAFGAAALLAIVAAPAAHADNLRLNNGVIANVYTVQRQAGCSTDIKRNPALTLAAQWHAQDVLNNRALDGNVGSDGSTAQDRAAAAGFRGKVSETVAINPALAINNLDVINQWYYDPVDFGIMSDCANTAIGVWSENSLDRSVVVAVFGQPA
ncbi:MAG TPA: CAP domain-containing protein [Mycobacterium sp.]|nr:CAP domain-containing protein [Mycobacterium sp.]